MNSEAPKPFAIELTRTAENRYVATNGKGGHIEFGRGEDLMSPVELLLAAVAGCSSIDVDMMTSRRAEPERFEVTAEGDYVHDDDSGNVLEAVRVIFDLVFPEGADGDKARERIGAAMQVSHDKECTVSRTIEAATPVTFSRA